MFRMKLRPGITARAMMYAIRRGAAIAIGAMALFCGAPAFAAGGGCPDIHAVPGNFQFDPFIGADFTSSVDTVGSTVTFTYNFSANPAFDEGYSSSNYPGGGVPGLIEYCIYPSQPPGNPPLLSGGSVTSVVQEGGQTWKSGEQIQGYFEFKRWDGDPSNIPIPLNDSVSELEIGTASWPVTLDGGGNVTGGAPTSQTLLLHVNDPLVCAALYPNGGSSTCFVQPGLTHGGPNPKLCTGGEVCKSVDVSGDGVDPSDPFTVPVNTLLNLVYTYTIVNNLSPPANMLFFPPTNSTSDINSGGGKDYYGCEQVDVPSPNGTPGTWNKQFLNYQNAYPAPGFVLDTQLKTGNCSQSFFFYTAGTPQHPGNAIVLGPSESVTFTIDMQTGLNPKKKQEFTSCGPHLLNSGFTAKWFQFPVGGTQPATIKSAGTLYSASTDLTPIYVNVVGCS
jgi:hypothetical protein